MTDDEILLLSRGPTFCPTPRHIDWAQVKADINDFSRSLRLKEYFYNEDKTQELTPNPFRLKRTWCPPSDRDRILNIYIDTLETDITWAPNQHASVTT